MKHYKGEIEVICGSMFSGKTKELITRLELAQISLEKQGEGYLIQVFYPEIDDRYGEMSVNSHDGLNHGAIPVSHSSQILENLLADTRVVGLDEAQFFDEGIVQVVETLSQKGIRVIIAGLDTDFRGVGFRSMPELMARATFVEKRKAVCMVCGEYGFTMTQRLVNGKPARYDDPIIMVGAKESYEPRCREHHHVERENGSS